MSIEPFKEALVLDIEIVTPVFSDLDQHLQEYLVERIKKDPRNATTDVLLAAEQSLVSAWGLSPIVCIGMSRTDKNGGILLQQHEVEKHHEPKDGYTTLYGPEKFMLEQFWTRALAAYNEGLRLVTFFGESFDLPVIRKRSAILGVVPTVYTTSGRYAKKHAFHLDLDSVLAERGVGKHFSLDYWCQLFNIPSSKTDMKGSDVAEAYRNGRIDDIGKYCMSDVKATSTLYTKLESTIIPTHFEKS